MRILITASPCPAFGKTSPFHYTIAGFGGEDVRCSRYERFGGRDVALAAVEAMEERNACLLANHGMICFADSITRAVANAAKLEMLVRQYLLVRSVGSPVLLSDIELAQVKDRYTTYSQQPRPVIDMVLTQRLKVRSL